MKRILSVVLALVLVLSTVAASAELTIMTAKTTHPNWPEMERIIEEAAGIEINALTSPSGDADRIAKFTTILTTGDDSVDILHVSDEMITMYIAAGLLDPLNVVMTPEVTQNYDQAFMADRFMDEDGNIYGVPNFNSTYVMYVNQELLDKAGVKVPTTLDEFTEVLKATTDPENGVYGYGGTWAAINVKDELQWFIAMFGGDVYDWGNEKSRAALEYMYDMMNTWGVVPQAILADDLASMEQKFYDGKTAIMMDWAGPVEGLCKTNGIYGEDHIHSMLMPTFEDNLSYNASWYFVLNPASKHKEEAYKYLQYIASKDYALTYLGMFDQPPARRDVLYCDEIKDPKFDNVREILDTLAAYNQNSTMHGRWMLPATMEYFTEIGTAFQKYVTNEITLDQAIELQHDAYERCK